VIVSLDKTLIQRLESFKALSTVCSLHWNFALKLSFGPWTVWLPVKDIIWRKMLECFNQKP